MAIGTKDWEFIYAMIEDTARTLYLRGYHDAVSKKPAVDTEKVRLAPGDKMRLQTLHANLTSRGKRHDH